jgi:predicted NUDIX family NTP pyrophosphohydrolase
MAPLPSAGILLYRWGADGLEVFIAHMGGPFWARKDARAWSLPKGEIEPGESTVEAARREFAEEIGVPVPDGDLHDLGTFRYSSGKTVAVYAIDAPAFEIDELVGGSFELEWPPRSGRTKLFPEVDEARWVGLEDAREKLVAGQAPALDALVSALA